MQITKGDLAIRLSMLKSFEKIGQERPKQKIRDEQYSTDAEIAAAVLWDAMLIGDIKGKVIVDLGCGTGILGIGALLLGAKMVFFVERDSEILESVRENLESESCKLRYQDMDTKEEVLKRTSFYCMDINEFDKRAETAIINPPFGTKVRHADTLFLKSACKIARVIYSLHKSETLGFIERILSEEGYIITRKWDFLFPLKASRRFHRRRVYRFKVSFIRSEKLKCQKFSTKNTNRQTDW